jgi:prepilin-type N-terminal cleavage/methylation domain-containing protein
MKNNTCHGFTLVELLIVIAVIAILSAIIFVIIDPVERLRESRDSQRLQEAQAIAEAIKMYKVDNSGDILCEMDGENGVVGIGGTIDTRLSRYFGTVPKDPKYDDDPITYRYYVDNFAICYNATTHVRVSSDQG